MTKALVVAYAALVLALGAAAVGIWRLRCESFGCMGVGVAWFAWAFAFLVVLMLGLLARSQAGASCQLGRICRISLWLQAAAGAALLTIWAVNNAA